MAMTLTEAAKMRRGMTTPGRSNPAFPLRPMPMAPPKVPMTPVQQQRRIPKTPPAKR